MKNSKEISNILKDAVNKIKAKPSKYQREKIRRIVNKINPVVTIGNRKVPAKKIINNLKTNQKFNKFMTEKVIPAIKEERYITKYKEVKVGNQIMLQKVKYKVKIPVAQKKMLSINKELLNSGSSIVKNRFSKISKFISSSKIPLSILRKVTLTASYLNLRGKNKYQLNKLNNTIKKVNKLIDANSSKTKII